MDNDGLVCILCIHLGLGHDGDHIVPEPKTKDESFIDDHFVFISIP